MNNEQIGKLEWVKRWAGSYTFISCAYWAPQYAITLQKILGRGFPTTLFIHKKGTASFLVNKYDLDLLGEYLAKKVEDNESLAHDLLNKLKKNADILMEIMQNMEGKILTIEQYKEFHKVFDRHLAYHVFMKKTVDYLPIKLLEKLLPVFKEARIYSEPIYSRTEQFFRALAAAIAQKEKHNKELLTCLMQEELETYLKNGTLPGIKELKERYNASALLFNNNKLEVITGKRVNEIENIISKVKDKNEVKGFIAHPGKVQGKVKIIQDPRNPPEFNKGDVLITGMTRPEFTPFMEKAAAIVTDAGGILCHAAITAREMKKPCIVGTENATKIFKDNDIVEVDADKGIIKRIQAQ